MKSEIAQHRLFFVTHISLAILNARENSEIVCPEKIIHISNHVLGSLFARFATANINAHRTPAINHNPVDP